MREGSRGLKEAFEVFLCCGPQREKDIAPLGRPGPSFFLQNFFRMFGILDRFVFSPTSPVRGDQAIVLKDPDLVVVGLQGQRKAGIQRRDGVAVRVEDDPAVLRGLNRQHDVAVEGDRR